MPIYALGDDVPTIHPDAFVHPQAVVIGSVDIGPEASVWPGAVLRGDTNRIVVGARTSVQDGVIVHCTEEHPTLIGADCVIGHLAHLEGCTIEDGAQVSSGAIVLHRVIVRTGAIVAAGAVALNDTEVPTGAIAVGAPATIKPDKVRPKMISDGAQSYLDKVRRYKAELRLIEP